jgi:hypothetical protein
MEKVGLPKGLIRYASEDEIVKKEPFKLTTRMKGYIAVLSILIGVFIGMLFLRNDVEATILHMPGQLFQRENNNVISNIYNYDIINKTEREFDNVTFKLVEPKGEIKLVGSPFAKVPKQGATKGTFFVKIKESDLKDEKVVLKIEVCNNGKVIETATTNFLGPRNFN